jgi:hypothetical protein
MATITATGATTHPTLAAAAVDTVTLPADYQAVEVLNRDSAATIYFTVDGTTPGVAADGTYVAPPGQGVNVPVPTSGNTVVKLTSSATAAYSVTGTN